MNEQPVFFDDKPVTEDPKPISSILDEEVADQNEPVVVQKPSLLLPSIALVFIVSLVLSVGYMVIRNRVYKEQLTNLDSSSFKNLIPTPTTTIASPSGQVAVKPTTAPQVLGVTPTPTYVETTKGGLPIVTPTPTPTTTPKVTPTPKPQVKGVSTTNSTSPYISKVYFDAQFPYRISFNDSWSFQRTHGNGTNVNSDVILSGVKFTKGSSTVLLRVYKGKGESNIENWINKYSESEKPSTNMNVGSFKGYKSASFSGRLGNGQEFQKTYLIDGAYVYVFEGTKDSFDDEIRAILNSVIPNTSK